MSRETMKHLNTNTLIGFTARRGTAWHYRAEDQGPESNLYQGAVPVEDVQRRLFHWTAEPRPIAVRTATSDSASADGGPEWNVIDGRQAITRSDTGEVMGIFADGYACHQYDEWLLTSVANLLDDQLSISSAGLLRGGAVAWVEVSVPESISTPEGVEFRPNLLATTSFDGSIATTFKRTITATVCDNTRDLALSETGQQVKVKHSKHSRFRLAPAREALALVHETSNAFATEVAQLCRVEVEERAWNRFISLHAPVTDHQGERLKGRSLTAAMIKRDALHRLYRRDERVAPWSGTAYGVLQAVNTYEHHERIVRGASRSERNMLRTVQGDFAKVDRTTWKQLESVLDT